MAGADMKKRVDDALRALDDAQGRARFARRFVTLDATRNAAAVIRDLARLAGVEVATEQKEAA